MQHEEIDARRLRLSETIRSILDVSHLPPGSPDAEILEKKARHWSGPEAASASLGELAAEVDEMADAVSRLVTQPLLAARRINVALERLQSARSVDEVLRSAPSELAWGGDFDRVLVSRVEESSWIPVAWYAADGQSQQNQQMADLLRDNRIGLASGMVEAEALRRKAPALVRSTATRSRSVAPFGEVGGSAEYVVAPIMTGDRVFGLMHVDTDASGRSIVDSDVTGVGAFASGLGLILERLALVDKLRAQRERIQKALAAANDEVDELTRAPVTLSVPVARGSEPPEVLDSPARIEDRFTAREREVFALLIGGSTNAQIADRLTVSETTVKSHVKHILRKMRATNRAQAIAQYLASGERR
ncbi:helix-turn-helix transcriptional regulator [Nocardioides jensenii]|uniref:helix-turn-helix transcriptional regulator n=1 Tax=Nocardioides jensenii TaxID=1843 RepID=UPI000829F1F4|nr:LuxR C-terminal-related transcriptional regulator [Nocardioides jensenii]